MSGGLGPSLGGLSGIVGSGSWPPKPALEKLLDFQAKVRAQAREKQMAITTGKDGHGVFASGWPDSTDNITRADDLQSWDNPLFTDRYETAMKDDVPDVRENIFDHIQLEFKR